MTFDPASDLKPGDRVRDTVLEEVGTFKRYYEANGVRYAAVVFGNDEGPLRIELEDLTLVEGP
jgi:hypothetical protein